MLAACVTCSLITVCCYCRKPALLNCVASMLVMALVDGGFRKTFKLMVTLSEVKS
jgi:hypothetical protein